MCVVSVVPATKTPSASADMEGSALNAVDVTRTKCAVVLRDDLALGSAANAAAVLGVSLGKLRSDMVGRDLLDSKGYLHQGITTVAIPILKATGEQMKGIRAGVKQFEPALVVVDVISATRSTRSYEEYAAVLETSPEEEIEYFGLALFGDKKAVLKFTGGLPLFR